MLPEALSKFYGPLTDYFEKAKSDLIWSLDKFIKNTGNGNVKRIYDSSQKTARVKSEVSLLRKCRRDGIVIPESITEAIEDLIGLKLVTPNKIDAREVFEFFRANKNAWFCDMFKEPKFTPMTIADRSKYSMETGYQAYHITFAYDHSYHPGPEITRWPVEIQITSRLWEYWASYSRKYFYSKTSGPMAQKLSPYIVAIARALDNAEDLMATTTNLLVGEAEQTTSESGAEN